MKHLFAAFAVLALAATPLQAAADETETVTRTVPLAPGGTLDLKTFSGRVTVRATDEARVTVNAVRHASRSTLDRVQLEVTSSGSTVYVDANHQDRNFRFDRVFGERNVVETELDVRVPRRTNLHIRTFSAPVEVDGVDADEISARTFSGKVDLRLGAWQPHERIDVHTFSGGTTVRVPDNASGHVDFDSFSGQLDSDLPLTLHSSSRRRLSAELGSAGDGSLRFRSFSGGVKIER